MHQIFLPIVIAVYSMFPGHTATQKPGDLCLLENHRTGEIKIYASDNDAWCDYKVEAGTKYTITVSSEREIVYTHTFTAIAEDQEY